jgi:hypothetical protein
MGWLWALLALVLLALLIWWATDDDEADLVGDADTELVGEETVGVDPVTPPEPVAMEAGISLADVLANPSEYVGRSDFQDEVQVAEVPTDRGFWVEDQGRRMFAVIIDNPQEQPKDINAGQQLRITEGMIRDATTLADLPGAPLDANTERLAREQDAYLVVDETNIEILSDTSS